MTKKSVIVAAALALCLLVSAATRAAPLRQITDPQVIWWTVDNGGGSSSEGSFVVRGTAGQPDTGTLSGGNFRLTHGFWGAVAHIAEATGSLTGVIFLDDNRNGVRDGGEVGIAGVTVQLVAAGASQGVTTVTAADGSYLFEDLASDDYTVTAFLPAAYTPTTETIIQVTLDAPQLQVADIGAAPPVGSITGVVFLDVNRNGTRDGGELGMEGATVQLLAAGASEELTDTTAVDGSYLFENLVMGNYTVTALIPVGYTPTTATVIQVALNGPQQQLAGIGATRLLFSPSISK